MPVRLTKPYEGQAANTLWWGSTAMENTLRGAGLADDQIELASDYEPHARIVTAATANTSRNATTYRMRSSSAQTLTIAPSGYWQPGQEIRIIQEGTGATTLVAASGVALAPNVLAATAGQYGVARLIKGWGETWDIVPSTAATLPGLGVGIGALSNFKASNTAKSRAGFQRPDRNFVLACVGPSTVAGQTDPVTNACATGSWPSRFSTALQARGINAGFQSWFGARNGYGSGPTAANLKAGDSRFDFTGAGGVLLAGAAFDSVGGNALGFNNAAGTMVFTPTAPIRKWKIWTGNQIVGRNLTASSGSSGAVAINSVADNSITETIIDSGSSGLNALTLTWVAGNVSVLGVVGYDDTNNRREISVLNWGISGAVSSRFNENVDPFGRSTLAMINKVAPDLAILSDLPINDWRTSVSVATSKANIAAVVDSFVAAGTEVWLTTPRFDNATSGFASNQDAYAAAMRELSAEKDLPLIDLRASLVSYPSASAAGRYSGPVHGSLQGYNADGVLHAGVIQQVMAIA